MTEKKSDILRSCCSQLCNVLATANTTMISFTLKLYEKRIIDMATKSEILERKGLEVANMLMDLVMMKINLRPERLELVLQIMEELEDLQDIVEKIRTEKKDHIAIVETQSSMYYKVMFLLGLHLYSKLPIHVQPIRVG